MNLDFHDTQLVGVNFSIRIDEGAESDEEDDDESSLSSGIVIVTCLYLLFCFSNSELNNSRVDSRYHVVF